MALGAMMPAFWDVAMCHLVGINQHFRGSNCLHNEELRDATSQKTAIFLG
jgi:hypothetical protein